MIGIYKITNPLTELYIGKSIDLERRIKSYKSIKNKNINLQISFKKYGFENHTFEIVEECDVVNLSEREIYWIKKLCKNNLMMNIIHVDFIFKKNNSNIDISKKQNQIMYTFKIYNTIICKTDGLLYQLEHCPRKRTKIFRQLKYNKKRNAYYINGGLVTNNRLNNLKIIK